jgi:AIPR protein
VRGSLGRTKVNKEIAKSIENKDEHKEFLLFHNGLTLLCKQMSYQNDKVEVSGYSVVNGCQSLTSLYENRSKVTDDLRLMARIIELPPGNALATRSPIIATIRILSTRVTYSLTARFSAGCKTSFANTTWARCSTGLNEAKQIRRRLISTTMKLVVCYWHST